MRFQCTSISTGSPGKYSGKNGSCSKFLGTVKRLICELRDDLGGICGAEEILRQLGINKDPSPTSKPFL